VQNAFDDIVANAELHSFVETLSSRFGYRRVHLRKYHDVIVDRIVGDFAVVVAVSHSSRRPNYWLGRL
jgi:plasmid stabilization system protein ParE